MPSGNFKAKVEVPGFQSGMFSLNYDANQPSMYSFPLTLGVANETVEVMSEASQTPPPASTPIQLSGRNATNLAQFAPGVAQQNASANVINLQKRVAGVLPVAIDVPHAGTSFAFVRPLVLNEETKVTFRYKSR
jgi:hypothetical protein